MENRPGIKTSEFWVTAIAMVLGALAELTDMKIDATTASMTFGPAAAYIVSRGMAKRNKTNV